MDGTKLTSRQLCALCAELAMLLHAGLSPADGLQLISEESPEVKWLRDMADLADDGYSLSKVMEQVGVFPTYVSALTACGERTGRTEEALQALADWYEGRDRLERYIRSALLYPAVLLILMLAVITVLLTRVLPVFDEVYASVGGQMTGLGGGLLALGRALDSAMPLLLILLAAAAAFLVAFAGSDRFRTAVLDGIRRASAKRRSGTDAARIAQALAMGLASGLKLEDAMELAASLETEGTAARKCCEDCADRLDRGEELSHALKESGCLPASACRMLALGVRSGSADTVMAHIAQQLEEESEEALAAAVGRVEPTLVIVTSVLVGAILLSVMLPLMNIMAAVG